MADLLQMPLRLFPDPPSDPTETTPDSTPEPQQTLRLTDADARIAALDIHRSWIVEAPAGSGKTGLLIQRFLKLLAFADLQRPGEVLAITFTRKAANELRTRVLEQLLRAARGDLLQENAPAFEQETRRLALAVLSRDRDRGWRLLESPHQLNIRTIDSFCGDLAGRVPLLSGGRRQPLEDASPLYEDAARRSFRELGGPDPVLSGALRSVLLHRDGQIGDCVHLIADMLANREQWGELISLAPGERDDENLDREVRPRLEHTLQRIICQGLQRAAAALDPHLLRELAHFAARLAAEAGAIEVASPIVFCAARPDPPGTAAVHLEHWLHLLRLILTREETWRATVTKRELGFKAAKPDVLWFQNLIAQLRAHEARNPGLRDALCALRGLPPAQFPDEQWRIAKALFRVLRHALIELTILFAERGVSDFTELSLTARSLLRSDADLLHLPGAQLAHLLVDEMQDTSSGQYDLLDLLTRGWDGRTQTLFLVGDPKQSVYYFRQARVERFLRTQSSGRLGAVPLGALRLTANFRSQAALVEQFNQTFGRILPTPDEIAGTQGSNQAEVPFVAATPTRPRGAQPALHWHARVAAPDPASQDESDHDRPAPSAGDDALQIRILIEEFLAAHPATPGEPKQHSPRVAVLARNRAHLAPVIAEFHRSRGHGPLPFRAVDIELLNDRPEVLDLLALTRALLHPADRVAWLAVLHSPVCGLGLADLLALTGEGPSSDPHATVAHLVETRATLLSPEGRQLLGRAWTVLGEAQASIGRTLLGTHVERTWRALGADALLRPDQLTNAQRFLHLLQELESGPEPLSIGLLERRLRKLYAEPRSGPVAVELMTIHKAKGLEWDLVLIPALERGSGTSQHELLKWLELDGLDEDEGSAGEIVLAPIAGKGDVRSDVSNWLARLQQTRETAEAKRLFYVACTRAKEELHLFAACRLKQSGELAKPRHNSLLRACWNAAEPVFQQAAASREPEIPTPAAATSNLLQMPSRPSASEPLALAASADPAQPESPPGREAPRLQRLPPDFDPLQRFTRAQGPALPYPAATTLRNRAAFARPEGSFAARAFGNVVHRFLELAADRLRDGSSPELLLSELPQWRLRVVNAFRSEGLVPALCQRDADRTLSAITATLHSPEGRWLLSPHAGARSERSFQLGPDEPTGAAPRNLRADRVFLAGPDPLSTATATHLWIVDFKTADPGGRPVETFLAAERQKYLPQMNAYARASLAASATPLPVILALFYPALTHLLYWPFDPFMASHLVETAPDTVRR